MREGEVRGSDGVLASGADADADADAGRRWCIRWRLELSGGRWVYR